MINQYIAKENQFQNIEANHSELIDTVVNVRISKGGKMHGEL